MKPIIAAFSLILALFALDLGAQGGPIYPPLMIQDESSNLARATRALNFTGDGVECTNSAGIITCDVAAGGPGSGAPTDATYIVQTGHADLSAEQILASLATGILKNTTTTGVLSIAVAGDFPTLNQSTTGTAAALTNNPGDCAADRYATTIAADGTLTCAQVSMTAGVTGTLPVGNGGLGITTVTDDTVVVANGSAWESKAVPDCDGDTTVLHYDTATNAFSCGDDDTGASSDTVLRLTAGNVSTAANTNLVDITAMSFTADPASTYVMDLYTIHQSAANTTGFGIGINCTQTPVLVSMTGNTQLANTGTTTAWSSIANNAIVGVTSGMPTNATNVPSHGRGVLQTHATNSGTCIFRLRSETTAVTTIVTQSTFIIRKVS